jgi:predicted HD phosphohydrolase
MRRDGDTFVSQLFAYATERSQSVPVEGHCFPTPPCAIVGNMEDERHLENAAESGGPEDGRDLGDLEDRGEPKDGGDPEDPQDLDTKGTVDAELLLAPLRATGGSAYLGEPVTVLEHCLQAAALAESEGRPVELVVAALLHDLGWLLHGGPRAHELRGAEHLERWFGPGVVEPVRLHVEAKRYLATEEPGYRELLSDASVRTMAIQGGAMTDEEVMAFSAQPFASDAVALRRLDDRAKVPNRSTPPLDHYVPMVESLLASVKTG